MADVTTASATSASGAAPMSLAPKPSTSKKAVKAKKLLHPAEHPKYRDMIASAIGDLKERRGSSRQAILKYILAHYKVGSEISKINARIKMALRAGIKNGALRQVKGSGASGSFRLVKKPHAAKPAGTKKSKAAAARKPAIKKVKVAGKKKTTGTKKTAKAKSKTAASKLKKSPAKTAAKKTKTKSPAKKVAKKATKPKKILKKSPAKKVSKGKASKK